MVGVSVPRDGRCQPPCRVTLGDDLDLARRTPVEQQQTGLQSWLWLVAAAEVGAERAGARGVQWEQRTGTGHHSPVLLLGRMNCRYRRNTHRASAVMRGNLLYLIAVISLENLSHLFRSF